MDIRICKKCAYYCKDFLTEQNLCVYNFSKDIKNGYFEKCEYIKPDEMINGCRNFAPQCKTLYEDGYFNPNNITKGDKMRNDNFKTELRSYDNNKCRVLSRVNIDCEDYEIFKKVVEAVMPILEKEDVKECE